MEKIPSVELKSLSFSYPERETRALDEICLSLKQGEFVVLCGSSGSGKTTLLRQLKPCLAPHGKISGRIFFEGKLLSELSSREAAAKIGFVMQNPENQIVADKVWHELAFALEALGFDTPSIRLRVAEMASFFGIQAWFNKNVAELSGGQKQLLTLASAMALQPSLLILDEPTSQLDPIAAADFLSAVGKVNRELGVTVILTEHRLEEAFPLADRVIVMDEGKILCNGTPGEVGKALRSLEHSMFQAMPVPMRVSTGDICPVTVREGREWLERMEIKNSSCGISTPQPTNGTTAVELDEVWFKYEKDAPDIIKGLSFKANFGCLTAILGGNGTGKTTALSLISGLNKPYRGSLEINTALKPLAVPQNPQSLFSSKTVREDLLEMLTESKLSKSEKQEKLLKMVTLCRLESLLDRHPYDLSGGEQQRAALAKVLLLEPKILLLDEPTKGLDAEFKAVLSVILKRLTAVGAAVIMVSHDIEFCAEHADYCALFFDGAIVTENHPQAFFSGNSFYTSAANRMARQVLPNAVTANDIITALGETPPPPPSVTEGDLFYSIDGGKADIIKPEPVTPRLTLPRIVALCAAGIAFVLTASFAALNWESFSDFIGGGGTAISVSSNLAWRYPCLMLALCLELLCAAAALYWRRGRAGRTLQKAPESRKLSKRTLAAVVMILLAIPLTIYVGMHYFGDRKYFFISLMIILEAMLPFGLVFERRKPRARELVVLAVLCAIGVAGRSAFFMLPQFKPVVAVVIIAGVAFGGESGFLVGAVIGFVSNMFFGQGPWTPWQMFAFGIIGFIAGILFKKGLLLRNNTALCVFGGAATFLIYGGIVNPSSMLMYQPEPTWEMLWLYYLQGIPFDLVHSFATVFFLAVAAHPLLEKLDRIKLKYGLVEVRDISEEQ